MNFEALDRAFEQGARAFRSRLPCRPPAHYSGDMAEAFTDGFWEAVAEHRASLPMPDYVPAGQLHLFGATA